MNLTGQRLGKYELVKRLGKGGMAEVYQALQPGVERLVAIKVLHPHLSDDEDFVKRFSREAKGIGMLDHPNIVRVIDIGIEADDHYIVLDYVSGGTLREYIEKNGLLPPVEALKIAAQLANAVEYAHQQGIIHRDIKPDNIMFTDDSKRSVVLTDFGLAHLEDATNITVQGMVIGTAAYISPEVLEGRGADERSDIYSLGIVLYEMLTGTTPYRASSPYGMMLKQIHDPLPPPREKNPDLPDQLERLVLKALEKETHQRFQSAQEFYKAIKQTLKELSGGSQYVASSTIHPSLMKKEASPRKRSWPNLKIKENVNWRPFAAVGGGVFLAALVTLIVLLLIPYMNNDQPSDSKQETELEITPTTESKIRDLNPTVAVNHRSITPVDGESIGVLRFADNEAVQAGDITLQIDQVTLPPEGSHYELWLVRVNADVQFGRVAC